MGTISIPNCRSANRSRSCSSRVIHSHSSVADLSAADERALASISSSLLSGTSLRSASKRNSFRARVRVQVDCQFAATLQADWFFWNSNILPSAVLTFRWRCRNVGRFSGSVTFRLLCLQGGAAPALWRPGCRHSAAQGGKFDSSN